MPREKRLSVSEAFQERYPRIYAALLQLIIAVLTFYCAVAISRYKPNSGSPTPASAANTTVNATGVPTNVTTSPSDVNSTSLYVCKNGARDEVDVGVLIAVIPHTFLCPDRLFFYFALVSFMSGILKFNILHTSEDIDLFDGYAFFILTGLVSLDWRHFWVSFQIAMPMLIWTATVFLPIVHLMLEIFAPDAYKTFREGRRRQMQKLWSVICFRKKTKDVENGGSEEGMSLEERAEEEVPLRDDEEVSPRDDEEISPRYERSRTASV